MKIKFRESLAVSGVGRVDRAANTIHGVRVCGLKSNNGRKYNANALRDGCKLYEGTRVFFDHPDGDSNARKYADRFGRLTNVRPADDGGLVADLTYNPKHKDAEHFLWLAENDPAGMGLSHNAEGQGVREQNGDVCVHKITKVHSVDIVDGPATNHSLYEQTMEPLTDPAAATPDAGTGADAAGDVNGKLSALAADFASHPDWDKKTKIEKLKALINLMEDGEADSDAAEAETEQEDEADGADMPEPEMMEQLGRFKSKPIRVARLLLAREQVRRAAAKAGLKPELLSDVFVEQLAAAPLKLREKLIEDRRKVGVAAGAEKPRNGGGGKPVAPPDAKAIAATLFG